MVRKDFMTGSMNVTSLTSYYIQGHYIESNVKEVCTMFDRYTVIAIVMLLVYFISLPFLAIVGYRIKKFMKVKEGEWIEEGRNRTNRRGR